MMFIFCNYANSQNLIKNPSFEKLNACPDVMGAFDDVAYDWHKPSRGTTDCFSACSETMPIGENFIGYQNAFEGNSYAGIYLYAKKNIENIFLQNCYPIWKKEKLTLFLLW